MDMDEKLKWLEGRIQSSLRPRNDDLKNMMLNDDNRLAFHQFLNNEDVRRLFVSVRPPRALVVSQQPPSELTAKSVFFIKNNTGVKLTKDNMNEEVMYSDIGESVLQQLDLVTREIYLPLLCTDTSHNTAHGVNTDRIMDVLHRLMATLETTQGHTEGEITLSLPSIEVLAEAAASVSRRGAVLHVLETTVIGWIKQIKSVLKHSPLEALTRAAGPTPGPLDEVALWTTRLDKLRSINVQLDSPVAQDILRNLAEANSTYASSFNSVRQDITKAIFDTEENLRFLRTMASWFNQLHTSESPADLLEVFAPLTHTLTLVWTYSKYYHQSDKFHNLLRLLSNEVVHRAESMVGADVLREPLQSYSKLKDALRVCAAFRGTYLDYRDKANDINAKNQQEHQEKMITRPQGPYTLFSTKLYGQHAFVPRYGSSGQSADEEEQMSQEELWRDSPWPARNAPCFDLLNSFMERCNDVLELVQTTRHFRLLADTADIGGAGSQSLDALVREIHSRYTAAMDAFFSRVTNVLAIDGSQTFEKAFFTFRTVVKDLERKLSEVLRQSFLHCPTIGAQLRLLEVFEGISSRELVQAHLRDKDQQLVTAFTAELIEVRGMFKASEKTPPKHKNMPAVVSNLMWIHALKQRVEGPMNKMKVISPHSLEGDLGWQLRDAYSEVMADIDRFQTAVISEWQEGISAELTEHLKQPILVAEGYDEDEDVRPQSISVNLDPRLLILLREIHYLAQEPFCLPLPAAARALLRNTDSTSLRALATRLETITSKYNSALRTMTEYEQPLFERCLSKIDHLFREGLTQYTWRTAETVDFIETASALVCTDLHDNLDTVQTCASEILDHTAGWGGGPLDVFSARGAGDGHSYSIEELVIRQRQLNEDLDAAVVPGGHRIHALVDKSFQAVQISEASPAWQDYIDFMDALVLDGLKHTALTSLKAMLNEIVRCNMNDGEDSQTDTAAPLLTIRLELIESSVAFRPPLDTTTSYTSVHETVTAWLDAFLDRGNLVNMLSTKGSYRDYISVDEEVCQLLEQINRLVDDNGQECKELYELFRDYSFLWTQDIKLSFQEFLAGNLSHNALREGDDDDDDDEVIAADEVHPSNMRAMASARSASRASSTKSSLESAGLVGTAERSFLVHSKEKAADAATPSLDEFEAEINIYKTARDELLSLHDYEDVGWLRVDLRPIKQVLTTYASKWMWTYTSYLTDQVATMLDALDGFLKRTEPEIESITGDERDTASFMKMMRLFNEVSAQQQEMDGQFAAMHRTVLLVRQFGHKLPTATQELFDAAPGRWSSLKTKVSLAKQRLGPRIQEESKRITQDLATFGERVSSLQRDLASSEVYGRGCSLREAWVCLDSLVRRLEVLENEAQDLIELQELLETNVVNFSILPQCHSDLSSLRQVWETVRLIDDQQAEWRRHRWQKMDTAFLREQTNKQLEVVTGLDEATHGWDVYQGLYESITTIQACLPLIDALSNPAMRTRHWKQLVRVTGGAVQVDNDTLKRMTLGELLGLGLERHVDDVRAIVQRAVKDLIIERSLKTYEEVWLSKVFELRRHVRSKMADKADKANGGEKDAQQGDAASEASQAESHPPPGTTASRSQVRTMSRASNQSSMGRTRRTSVSSLPSSLLQVGEDTSGLLLLHRTAAIFDELESHQVALTAMQSSSAAGSFLDEVLKWQKRLQTIEAVLTRWLDVQRQWAELEEVFGTQEVRTALSHDANTFAVVSRDFHLLMKATEKNPNVLQCCQRKNIQTILEKMTWNLDVCHKSLLSHLERRRGKFPRFFFLSAEDVLHIICNGYDLAEVNQYISKLFEQMSGLVYEEVEDPDKYQFVVTGVRSILGETLPLNDPVPCEGHIESWLLVLLSQLKSSLQSHLSAALRQEVTTPRPGSRPRQEVTTPGSRPVTRDIHSAGARRVSATERKGSGTPSKDKSSRAGSRQSQRIADPQLTDPEPPQGPPAGQSWTLTHSAQVVYLCTQLRLVRQTTAALEAVDGGDKDALQAAVNTLSDTLRASVTMLRGLEGQREARLSARSRDNNTQHANQRTIDAPPSDAQSGAGTQRSGPPSQSQPHTPVPDGGMGGDVDGTQRTATPGDETQPDGTQPELTQEEIMDCDGDMRLLLFPAQIQKLASLIGLLAHQRDLLERLHAQSRDSNQPIREDFTWMTQLQHTWDEEAKSVNVEALQYTFEYGFEYQGSAPRAVLTPHTEQAMFQLTQSLKQHVGGMCVGQPGDGGLATLQELSLNLGKPLYVINCTQKTSTAMLYDIFKGFATAGAWICFNNISHIPGPVLSTLAQLLGAVTDALRAARGALHLQTEELILNNDAACFSTLNSAIKLSPHQDPEKLLIFDSAVARLPSDLLQHFRVVSIVKPELRVALEAMLLSQGFLSASDLARRTLNLYDLCRQMIGTNTPLINHVAGLTYNSQDLSNGWSLKTLKYVAAEAGAMLDTLAQKAANQDTDKTLAAILEEDGGEKQDLEKSEKDGAVSPQESAAVVLALRNLFMPRLHDSDAVMFTQFLKDLWPDVDVPLTFGGGSPSGAESTEDSKSQTSGRPASKPGSRAKSRTQHDTGLKSYRDSLNLNTPVAAGGVISALGESFVPDPPTAPQPLSAIDDAIAVATTKLGLMPGMAFQARVSQLAQLSVVHRTIVVAGQAGCGKSECIKTFALAERERGKTVDVQSVFTKAYESPELLGHYDQHARAWRDGLLPCLLRKFCIQGDDPHAMDTDQPLMKVMQLDGEFDADQFEIMEVLLQNDGSAVLGNNERLVLPHTLRFVWETDSVAQISPAVLSTVGLLAMSRDDVGWAMILAAWLERRPEADRDLLQTLADIYLGTILDHLGTPAPGDLGTSGLTHVIRQSEEGMVHTFCAILDAQLTQHPDLSDCELERMFNCAAVWAFGGTLQTQSRDAFSVWWRQTFEGHVDYPEDGTVFDYTVDPETRLFVKWAESVPAYSSALQSGIPADAFVHTSTSEQMLHLLSLLTDYGKPVMLAGGAGCGKSSLVAERLRAVCSGEVAEVLGLTLTANRFTNARLLYERLDELLEWKHGQTYVPRGNKRLLCFLDDLNLSQTDRHHKQTALELIRQHVDDGGFYNPEAHSWRYVTNVTYVTALEPRPAASVPPLNPRLLRHWAVFACPSPSEQEQQTIFTTLLQTHFIRPEQPVSGATMDRMPDDKPGVLSILQQIVSSHRAHEAALRDALNLTVGVTLEIQHKLRGMFLPTAQRCHYIFSLRDTTTIFRNLCLSLKSDCTPDDLLLLWEHECYWVYGHRMVSEVDYNRFRQCFVRAVRKNFTSEEQIGLLTRRDKPVYSNLIEQDSGLVTAGTPTPGDTSGAPPTDLYRPVYSAQEVRELLERGVEEYNKTQPRIQLALYRPVLEQVCRLARVLSSPHEVSHWVLVAEGCAGRTPVLVNLAAHLSGFTVFKISPGAAGSQGGYSLSAFKADIVTAYTRAGVKGERVLFVLEDQELVHEDFLVFLSDFIVSAAITHLFSAEEQTTIINSIRTEVTQAGLTYTRQVAWDFFCRTVKKNFRICYICSEGGADYQRRCREYPNFTKNVNFLWFGHWTKKQLIRHAAYHLKELRWLTRVQKENVSHMLATMHLVARQEDGGGTGCGEYNHLTNLTYTKFVERFLVMAGARHTDVQDTHSSVSALMAQIQRENSLATKLQRELQHERVVLAERSQGTVKILAQIGQDTAITEQQVKIVKAQMVKIQRLKKLLPEYQVAHERAVYKTVSIVADTKKVVQDMDLASLGELRGMQKPCVEIEDLLAAIIMILKKNPQADLTWQKGAKRQMANLERFTEELLTFDEDVLPESTLVLVEPYLNKSGLDPEAMERRNVACASLCRWVSGVCRYHRMMISKVKPLHNKVEETMAAIDSAEHKMNLLDNKRKGLEVRLADLAKGFEEATIDKNEQEDKAKKMDKMLETSARLKKVLRREQSRLQQIVDSLPQRQAAIFGGVAMAAGLACYLGPYHYSFRRLLLTVHWPNCLRERGVPLVIDSIDQYRGRVVDWSIDGLHTAAGASTTHLDMDDSGRRDGDDDELSVIHETDEQDVTRDEQDVMQDELGSNKDGSNRDGSHKDGSHKDGRDNKTSADRAESGEEKPRSGRESADSEKKDVGTEKDEDEKMEKDADDRAPYDDFEDEEEEYSEDEEEEEERAPGPQEHEDGPDDTDLRASSDGSSLPPAVTADQYTRYVQSLVKLLVGDDVLQDWLNKDMGARQMENAAIVYSSWQRPPLLLDPYGEGVAHIRWLSRRLNTKRLLALDTDARSDPALLLAVEKAVMRGRPLLMAGCDAERVDSLLTPIIHHRNTATVGEERREDGCREPRMIKYCGRRILCHPDFRLYLATTAPKPRPSPATASMVTLVNYGASNDTVLEELLTRALARVRPELYTERRAALKNIHTDSGGLLHLWSHFRTHLHSAAGDREALFDEGDVEVVADLTSKTQQMSSRLEASRSLLSTLDALRAELTPVARRGAKLYALLRSLAAVRPEYQTPLPEFYAMFDEALGGEFPEEYGRDSDEEYEDDDDDADSAKDARTKATSSQMLDKNQRKDEPVPESAQTPDPPPETATEKEDGRRSELFELPELIPLSGDGEQYSSLPDQQVTEMMGRLNALVFTRIKYSLYPEDRLPVAALLTLAVQEENGAEVTEEETSLLLQGNPGLGLALSLADFDSDAEPPTWLSVDRWDDLLAVSVLPGPLDSLCVHVAENSAAWQDWYRSPQLQTRPLPVDLAGVPRLIVLRLLRPDQLPAALQEYVAETSASVLGPAGPPTLPETPGGVLVLLPPIDEHRASELSRAGSTEDCISVIAERQGNVKVDTVTVADGNEAVVMDAVDAAERDNQWCVVRHLHLASPALLRELTGVVHRMVSSRRDPGSADTKPQTIVWFTTVPGHALPTDLLLLLHTLSWDALPELVRASGAGQAGETQDVGQDKLPCGSLDGALPQAIIAALRAVPRETWQQVALLPQPLRLAVFGAAVVGGVVATRQLLGARGLSQYGPPPAPRHGDDLAALVRRLGEERVSTALVCRLLSQVGVGAGGCVPWDRKLLEALAVDIISRVADAVDDTVSVGGVAVPVPPANVEPADYAQWLEAKMPASTSTDGLSLPGAMMRGYNNALAARLLHTLDHLYQAQSLPLGASLRPDSSPVDRALRLRAVLDDVAEQLPPLLELAAGSPGEYDFPYHRPSVLSTATVDPRPLPECVGRVLLEECLWINSLLCHVRQTLHEIRGPGGRLLLSGREALPRHLMPVVDAVLAECVPASWVHTNCQPCPHSLADWLADLRRRHQQMRRWVRAGLVAGAGASDTQPRGRLTEVWAGGLANPRALFVALRQEKAVLEGCLLDQVRLEVGASEQEGESITLLDVHLQGASWDADRECVTKLSPSTGDLATLPGLSVRAVTPEGTPQNTDSPRGRYRCPVYVNTARQVCQLDLDLSCEGEEGEPWAAKAGVGLVLQAGIPESATKSRRSLLVAADNARQTSVRSHSSGSSGQEEEDEDFSEDDGEETERSQQSQLSYKTMTPQATPLPPELLMTRGERPMAATASPPATSRQPSESSADSRPRAASRTSQASRGSHTSRTSRISQGSRSKASSKGGQSEPTSQGRASEGKSRKESTQHSSDKGSNSDRGSQGNPSNKGSNGRATPDSTKDTASLKSDQRTTDRRGSRTSVASGSKQSARSHSPRTSEQAANSPRTSEQPANSPRTSEQPANSPRTSEQAAGSIRSSGQATNSPRTKGKVSPAPSNKSSEKDRTREEDNPGRAGFLD